MNLTDGWKRDGKWMVSPGTPWCPKGNRVTLGNGVTLGDYVHLGNDVRLGNGVTLGPNATDAIDLGHVDGYRKCLAQVKGIAYVGAGCRWFTLAEAIKHWSTHGRDRRLTVCLLQSAIAIAALKGWRHE